MIDLDPRHDQLTVEAVRHVLGFHGYAHGYPPGNFHRLLIQTITAADTYNRRALADAFPDYVAAVELLMFAMHGRESLQQTAQEATQ